MLGDGEGLQSEIKFAVAATYEKFARQWELPVEKLRWVDRWSPFLSQFTVGEINSVADYCVKEFRRPPVLFEFIELVTRVRTGKSLLEPIVSKIERMAYLILSSEEFNSADVSNSDISDACLVAAAIVHLKSYAEVLPNAESEFIIAELSGRARMFAAEASNWKQDAEENKGYWADVFKSSNDAGD